MARPITSLEGFVRKTRKLFEERKHQNLLFRGHSQRAFELQPSIFRSKNHSHAEHLMIRQLMAAHPREFESDVSNFDRLVRAQHYSLPTRLLDVSTNPLIALYFSACSNPSSKGQVIVLTPDIPRQMYFDSDTVSCLSALSMLKHSEKEEIREAIREIWKKEQIKAGAVPAVLELDFNKAICQEFNKCDAVKKLIQIVRQEKPDFRPILLPADLIKIVSVIPKRTHARINAQSGGFLLFGLGSKPNDFNMPDVTVETFDIDSASKSKILDELKAVGVSEDTLFPEIERSARQIAKRYS